jgi:hypothetical protein
MQMTRVAALCLSAIFYLSAGPAPASQKTSENATALDGCTFQADPSEFLEAQSRVRQQVFDRVRSFKAAAGPAARAASASAPDTAIPRRNFIDDDIFGALDAAGVKPAALTSDAEFIRRVTLDLTGRLPSPEAVRQFVSSGSGQKRDDLIDSLLNSPEFSDKWATWFADLIQNSERLSTSGRTPQIEGRNALDIYIRDAIANRRSVKQIVTGLLTGSGNNFLTENGPANYMVLWSTAMGPAQDTYDTMLARTASQFLGVSHFDCLLCHNGRGHLTGISLWGEQQVRADAQRMAAFFSRVRFSAGVAAGTKQGTHPLYNSTEVQEATAGQYDLNTTWGNRPKRVALGTVKSLTPEYRDGAAPAVRGVSWRQFYASKLVSDPMFSRNFANRLWKAFFGLGLVDPVDTLDPSRLDPKNPPPAPWTLQASHPELLEKLARQFAESDGDLRGLIRTIVTSSAWQLSSDYDYEWKYEYLTLYPRHYPRRLDAEEVIDNITIATGLPINYTWPLINSQTVPQGTPLKQSDPVQSAYKLPDITEPRSNPGGVLAFMNSFLRGNRDTSPRSTAGSILQQLSIMNDQNVTNRIKTTGASASPILSGYVKSADNAALIEDMWMRFLGRQPGEREKATALAYIQKSPSRNTAVEDLAWACLNKLDFLFSY